MEQKPPGRTAPGKGGTREERLKAALKANMARRKAQALARTRARAEKETPPSDNPPGQDTGKE